MSEMKANESIEYARDLSTQVLKAMEEANGHYAVNQDNMKRFNRVYDYFVGLAEENDGEVKQLDIRPQSIHARISVEVPSLDLHGDDTKAFLDILGLVDVFAIRQTAPDNLLIETGVDCVWEAVKVE